MYSLNRKLEDTKGEIGYIIQWSKEKGALMKYKTLHRKFHTTLIIINQNIQVCRHPLPGCLDF
jgi:hypothetical protein